MAALIVLTGLSLTGGSGAWGAAGWGGWANGLLAVLAAAGALVWWLDWRGRGGGNG